MSIRSIMLVGAAMAMAGTAAAATLNEKSREEINKLLTLVAPAGVEVG